MNEYSMTEHVEKMVLAKAIHYPENRKQLSIEDYHFEDPRHAAIYRKIINEPDVDKNSILNDGVVEPEIYGGFDFVNAIVNYPIATKHSIIPDQKRVFHFYSEREGLKYAKEYVDNPNEVTELTLRKTLEELSNYQVEPLDNKKEALVDIMGDINGESHTVVIKTGCDSLDESVNGLEMQQLNLIGARPSVGKTAFALELSQNLAMSGVDVMFCSLETTEKNLTQRLLSSMSRVELSKFKNPAELMTSEESQRVIQAIDRYDDMSLNIKAFGGLTPSQLKKVIDGMDDDKPKIVFIDYLTLMESENSHNSNYESVTEISKELKRITQTNENVTIIALAQLNRAVTGRQDQRAGMADLRDSGQIEQDGSIIMTLYRDDLHNPPEEPSEVSPMEVIVVKNKDGGTGTAEIDFYPKIQKFY